VADYVVQRHPGVTVYIADQRGVGLSSPVDCDNPPALVSFDPSNGPLVASCRACNEEVVAKYGDNLRFYSTHNAAQDLLAAIQSVNPTRVALYALSYGTYLANMFLQLPGASPDVVVLDGPVPAHRPATNSRPSPTSFRVETI